MYLFNDELRKLDLTAYYVKDNGEIELKIPSGSQTGDVLRAKGKGIKNVRTGKMGDLYIVLI